MKILKRAIIAVIDGARFDIFKNLLDSGYLSGISRFIGCEGTIKKGRTVFPSVSGPACLAIFTGQHPARIGIPGLRWFDRKNFSIFPLHPSSFRSYVGPGMGMMHKDIKQTASFYTMIKNHSAIFSMVNMKGMNNVTSKMQMLLTVTSRLSGRWDIADNFAGNFLLYEVSRKKRLITVVFPGIDELSHLYAPDAPEVIEAYLRVDRWIEKVHRMLDKQGDLNKTIFIAVSDHGMTQTHKHIDLDKIVEDVAGPTLFFPFLTPSRVLFPSSVVMTSGNSMSHIYLKHPDGWEFALTIEEIEKNYPLLLSRLIYLNGIKYVFAKSRSGKVVVFQNGNQIELEEHMQLFEDVMPVFKCDRCGDIVVVAEKGYDLRRGWLEVPPHHASHGGLDDEHMDVPVVISAPGFKLTENIDARTVDIFPTAIQAMGMGKAAGIIGRSMLKE